MHIEKVSILFLLKWQTLLFGLFGLLCGVLYSVGGLFYDLLGSGLNKGTALAFLALPTMPIFFALCGAMTAVVLILPLNLVLKWLGGIRLSH